MTLSTLIVVISTILAISIHTWKRYRFKSSMTHICVPLYLVSKWLQGNVHSNAFLEFMNICNSKIILAYFASKVIYPTRLQLM